jgi:DNA polymerase IV (DinB-like DNA polymerase)
MTIIGHLDMDAFFAAVEEREHPRLKGRPIVVGADPLDGKGRGVVSTANYAARKYGIHSAMPISKAWRLAEEGRRSGGAAVVFMDVNFKSYGETSDRIMAIVRRYAPRIEEASIDEAYFDLSEAGSFAEAEKIARTMKRAIKQKEKLTASIGLGPNKMVAKIASDFEKPDGLTVVPPERVLKFLAPMSVRKIPGVGPKTEIELVHEGITTVEDVRRFSRAELTKRFGKWGGELYDRSRGIASAEIIESWTAKSLSEEYTFDKDTLDAGAVTRCMEELASGVARRFEKSEFISFRTVTLKVRFEDFRTVTRAHTFPGAVKDAAVLSAESLRMIMPFLDSRENPGRKKLRLLGLKIERLT